MKKLGWIHWFLVGLFVFNFIARMGCAMKFSETPYFTFTLNMSGPDQNFFARWAEAIMEGRWVWEGLAVGQPFQVSPFYSCLLALSFWVPKSPFVLIFTLQALLSSALVGVFYALGKKLHQPAAGVWGALLWTFYGPSYLYDAALIRESLVTSIGFLMLWQLVAFLENPEKKRHAVTTGILNGLLTALRPHVFFIVIPGMVLLYGIFRKSQALIVGAAVILGIAFVVISPFTVYNWKVSGQWVPVSQQGADALILGNDPTGAGVAHVPTPLSARILEESGNRIPSAIKLLGKEVLTNPSGYVELYTRKIKMFLNDYEIPGNYSYSLFRRMVPESRIFFVSFLIVFPLAVIGLIRLRAGGTPWLALHVLTAVMIAAMLTIHIQSRYRFPVMPWLIVFAGYSIVCLRQDFKNKKWMRLTAQGILIVCLMGFAKPLPSYGLNYVIGSDGARKLNTDPIQASDYITATLAYTMEGRKKYAAEIKALSQDAYASYGNEYIQLFRIHAEKFVNSLRTTPQ